MSASSASREQGPTPSEPVGLPETYAGAGPRGFSTDQVHIGQSPESAYGARVNPIYMSAGFVFDDFDQAEARFGGGEEGYSYSRVDNPTTAAVERKLAALEGGTGARLVSSGQAAVHVATSALLQAGDHILASSSIYEGTRALFRITYARFGIAADFVEDPSDLEEWRSKVRPTTKLLFAESIPNPKNDIHDLAAIAQIAHDDAGAPLIVDNTLATPYLCRPIEHGADIVLHSTSKFLVGQGTALGGVIIGSGRFDFSSHREKYPQLSEPVFGEPGLSYIDQFGPFEAYIESVRRHISVAYGTTSSPFNAFLLQQGLETLSMRIQRQTQTAQALAGWLEEHELVESVDYSGLESSPYHRLARKYLPRGQGAVLAFTVRGGRESARALINSVELISRMTHIGDVRTLIINPATTTHGYLSQADRDRFGISDGLIRLSIGLEDAEDLIADLQHALAAVPRSHQAAA